MSYCALSLIACHTGKVDKVYSFLKMAANTQYQKANSSFEQYQKQFHPIASSKIKGLSTDELSALFDKFSKDREEIGSFMVMNAIVYQFGEIRTKESAIHLLEIYKKHRWFFDGEAALNFRCSFKNLGKIGLSELYKINIKIDTFLQQVANMVENNKPCI